MEVVKTLELYPPLPVVQDFTCTFIRTLESSDVCSVLVVSLPDGTERILKVGAPEKKGYEDPFMKEYDAYTALLHHNVCRSPDSTSTEPRVVPYCYGLVLLQDLRKQMRRASYWKSPLKKHLRNRPLYSLLLEYIPNAVTFAAEPARLSQQPQLVTTIVDALRSVHSAGVYHNDPMPRNVLLDENGGVWWIDFGSSYNTALTLIEDGWFESELNLVECLLLDDVIPAERKGAIPFWRIVGR
jgi:serine/threonine protein kinase